MKNILFSILALLFVSLFTSNANAQTAADETAVKTFWKQVWKAYEVGNVDEVMKIYADNATSITPDGRLQSGKAAMKEDWEAFTKMTDAPPKFTYEEPSIRVITADVAIVNYFTQADIKIGGQQVGGKMLGIAILHKVNGKWIVEADSMTPVMEMPETGK
jgi:uncharacterized protein (TIGR02246 family)